MSDAPEFIYARPIGATVDWTGSTSGPWALDDPHNTATKYTRADLSPQWMDIETAPKDGTVVLVLMPSILGHGKFSDGVKKGYWMVDLDEWQVEGVGGNVSPQPTSWTPIPKPPTE